MKAIDLLSWVVSESIDTTAMDIIDIDEDFDFEVFFGYTPVQGIPYGKYAYLYGDVVDEDAICKLATDSNVPFYAIRTDMPDRTNGGNCIIYLFKIDE